jgi:hypothetical protein
MANFGKEGRTEPVIGKISQETLAEMIGTTRSRVSVFMNIHEQIPQAWVDRVQWGSGGSQLSAERGPARQSTTQKGGLILWTHGNPAVNRPQLRQPERLPCRLGNERANPLLGLPWGAAGPRRPTFCCLSGNQVSRDRSV